MRLRIYDPKVLAIDLRHRRFGYAVYEGHRDLLDWGVRVYRSTGEQEIELLGKRLLSLFQLFEPSIVVLKRERWDLSKSNELMRSLVETVEDLARMRSIQIKLVREADLRETFRPFECRSREEIAEVLTRIFPPLAVSLPPKRRRWESEHPRMTVFDAIALGLSYWHRPSSDPPPPWDDLPTTES